MFTGIVERMGVVKEIERGPGGMRLVVSAPGLNLEVGDSIAVNGVCLTAVDGGPDGFGADVVLETLEKTNLGAVVEGERVNLERPLAAAGRFDGHIVQGHVDGTGTVEAVEPEGDGRRMTVAVPGRLARYIASKGSVAVDGVSLTVAAVEGASFSVALIPHTLEVTTLGTRSPGERVNLEVDVLAKYVERMMGMST
jgi:riboflavin synthase